MLGLVVTLIFNHLRQLDAWSKLTRPRMRLRRVNGDLFLPSALFSSCVQPYLPRLVRGIPGVSGWTTHRSRLTLSRAPRVACSLPSRGAVSGESHPWRNKGNIKLAIFGSTRINPSGEAVQILIFNKLNYSWYFKYLQISLNACNRYSADLYLYLILQLCNYVREYCIANIQHFNSLINIPIIRYFELLSES